MDPTDNIDQQLDDILLDDLVDAQKEAGGSVGTENLTPGQSVYDDQREEIVSAELARLAEQLGVEESTQVVAKSLFDQFVSKKDASGYALEVLAAACLYAACKVESVPFSPDDFAGVPQVAYTRVILLRRVKDISSTLGLDPRAFFDPHGYIDRYCTELGLNEEITDRAHEVIDVADEAGIGGGKSPTGRAAGAIYNAVLDHGREATQSEIANVADASEVTIRHRYQDQRDLLTDPPQKQQKPSTDQLQKQQKPSTDQLQKQQKPSTDQLQKQQKPSTGKYVSAIERIAAAHDDTFTVDTFETESEFTTDDVIDEFGSWPAAIDVAGVDKSTWLLTELRKLAAELGHQPRRTEMNLHGPIGASAYADQFGSYNDVVDAMRETTTQSQSGPNTSEVATSDPGEQPPNEEASDGILDSLTSEFDDP